MNNEPIEANYEQTRQQALIQENRLKAALYVLDTQGLITAKTYEALCDMASGMRYLYEQAIRLMKEQEGAKND